MLTTLKIAYVITSICLTISDDDTIDEIRRKQKWEANDYTCKGCILDSLVDLLFDVYQDCQGIMVDA